MYKVEHFQGDIPVMIDLVERLLMSLKENKLFILKTKNKLMYIFNSSVFGGSSRENVRSDIFF